MKKGFLSCLIVLFLIFGITGLSNATPVLNFLIDGNTYTQPFSITNSSTDSEKIIRFQLDISPVSMIYDTVTGGPPNNGTIGVAFTPTSGSDTLTGLNGPVIIADGSSLLDITFSDFDAGETFSWDIDIDGASGSPISVFGNNLIGAVSIIDFSDGQRLTGSLAAVPGNSDASSFTVTGVTLTPNAVPEPATMILFGLGLIGFAGASRKNNIIFKMCPRSFLDL